jgi:hypothetical protein
MNPIRLAKPVRACRSARFAVAKVLIVGSFAVINATAAAAQGCAMCYQSAAAAGANGQSSLRHGILILLIPALSLFGGIIVALYRRRNTDLPNLEYPNIEIGPTPLSVSETHQ